MMKECPMFFGGSKALRSPSHMDAEPCSFHWSCSVLAILSRAALRLCCLAAAVSAVFVRRCYFC